MPRTSLPSVSPGDVIASSLENDQSTAITALEDGTTHWGGTSSGAANTFEIGLTPAVTAYTTGLLVAFLAHQANSGSATLNVDSVGANTIKQMGGSNLSGNEIVTGKLCILRYDGTNFHLLNPEATGTLVTAGIAWTPVTTSISRNAAFQEFVIVDASGTTQTLPDPTTGVGQEVQIYRDYSGGAPITVDSIGGELIDGSSTDSITTDLDSRKYISDGTNWRSAT